jgi:hypothetical protein
LKITVAGRHHEHPKDPHTFKTPFIHSFLQLGRGPDQFVSLAADGAAVFYGRQNCLGVKLSNEVFQDEDYLYVIHRLRHKVTRVGN